MFMQKPQYTGYGLLSLVWHILALFRQLSGWNFALDNFPILVFYIKFSDWFGIQLGLYIYLKNIVHKSNESGKILAISGTTSSWR